ncbi:MAG: hypothetical protein Q8L48_42490 [Archangium sp.]|nr:hypothetical protein [Archangium sp.]
MRAALLLLLLTGCAGSLAWVNPGAPLTKLPPGLSWCGTGPEQVPVSIADEPQVVELIPGALLQSCSGMLKNACIHSDAEWRGSIHFRLSSDVGGHLTDVCVAGGNFGEVTDFVACIAADIKRSAIVEPEMKRVGWTMTYVCD